MFLFDYAEFTKKTGIAKTFVNAANTIPGKFLFKDSRIVKHYDKLGKLRKNTNGILQTGKSLRTSPFVAAGIGAAGYGAYRTKKVYDKYKPEINMGRKIMRNYNSLKERFKWGENNVSV